MQRIQHGFTLIELMIVVAIIGVLTAIAIPAYQDYTRRAHVAEGLSMASSIKASVSEYYTSKGSMPTILTDIGVPSASDYQGNAVDSIDIHSPTSHTLYIAIQFNNKLDGQQLVLVGTPTSGGILWDCAAESKNAIGGYVTDPVPDRYAPSNCRS